MTDLSQIAASTRDSIGRYFSLVSAVPSGILIAWTALLVGSGAWTGQPDPIAAFRVLRRDWNRWCGGTGAGNDLPWCGDAPLQFFFVQLLEGYWGVSPLAQQVRRRRTRAHRNRILRLRHRHAELGNLLHDKKVEREAAPDPDRKQELNEEIAELKSDRGEIKWATADYPMAPEAFMPTRLGSVLRRYEWSWVARMESR